MAFLGALFGMGGGNSSRDRQNQQTTDELTRQLSTNARYGLETGRSLVPKATGSYELVEHLLRKNLDGGSDSDILSFLAPAVRQRKQQTQARINMTDFLPRGGGRAAEMSRVYDDEYADLLDLITQQKNFNRTQAFEGLTGIGDRYASLGSSLINSGSGSAASGLNALFGQQQLQLQRRGQNMEMIAALAKMAGSIAGGI